MPPNLRLLEAKFRDLDRKEEALRRKHRGSSLQQRARALWISTDPEVSTEAVRGGDGGATPTPLTVDGLRSSILQADRFHATQKEATDAALKATQANYASHAIAMKERAAAFVERERQHVHAQRSLSENEHDDLTFVTMVPAHDDRRIEKLRDEYHFHSLFGRSNTPTQQQPKSSRGLEDSAELPSATRPVNSPLRTTTVRLSATATYDDDGAGRDNDGFPDEQETAQEQRIIESMMCSDPLARAAPPPPLQEATHRDSFVRNSLRRPQTASQFVNPHPARMRIGSASAARQKRQDLVEERPRSAAVGGSLDRLTQAFFRSLPPIVPPTGVAASTKQVARPSSSHAEAPSPDREAPRPRTAGLAAPQRTIDVPQFARTAQYYYLQVRIVHAAASLVHWEFSVLVSDVTRSEVTPRHLFRGLRVNAHRYLIFQPPENTTLDPVRQLPWVVAPDALYGHTLRVEVFATSPISVKVVDTMVHYGIHP